MNIFDIKREFAEMVNNSVDPETGECILDEAAFDKLQMQMEEKILNTAKFYRNEEAFINELDAQIEALKQRKTLHENRKKRLGNLLDYALEGQQFETPEVLVKFTKSVSTVIDDEAAFLDWAAVHNTKLLTFKPVPAPTPNKTEIKKFLKANPDADIPARLQENRNISVK